MKPGTPVLRSTRLLYQVRKRIRYIHYSLSTEKAYLPGCAFMFDGMAAVAKCGIRTVQELLRYSDVSTTMICKHVLKVAAGGTASPLDSLAFGG